MKIMLPEQLIAPPLLPPEQFCRPFSLAEILSATNNFDESLVVGHGGFGKVYHGVIDNGANTVAIKRLNSTSKQGDSEFRAEIELLSKFRHTHIVSLIGYCSNSSEMILVYDYMVNGSLADHLYKIGRHGNGSTLSWVQRLKICLGAARGLDYLHTGTTVQGSVIHRDVKSSNILLNKNWAAKVSDFGLSRISPNNQSDTHISTNVKGTVGYMDPEYLLTLRLTMKSDVYSFGIVLFEVLCGRRAVDLRLDEEQWSLARWVSRCIKEGTLHQVIDPKLKWEILPNSLTEFVRIADQCLCYRSKKRPTMTQVVASLEFALALQLGTGSSSTFEMDIFSTSEACDNLKRVDSEIGQQKVINFGNSDEHINDEQKEEIAFYAQEVDSETGQQEAIKFGNSDEPNEEIVSSAQEVSASENKMGSIKNFPVEDSDHYSSSLKTTDMCRPVQISNSSKNLWKEPTSPRWKNNDSSMKPISRFPIEPAPWRQLDGTRGSQKPASRHLKAPAKPANPFPSVYCEIEKRLSDLEFTQSGKDLRALKQILEAMQAKGLLETRKEGEDSNFASQKEHDKKSTSPIQQGRLVNQRKQQSDHIITSANRGTSSSRNSESSIVIMKPAKLVEKSGIHASSVMTLDGLSSLPKLQGGEFANNRKGEVNSRSAKDQILPKTSRRDNAINSTDMRTNSRNIKMAQTSTRPQQSSKESTTISMKSSVSTSPRLQQKKIELEKRSRPPTPPSDSSKSRRQPNKQQTESNSPGGRRRPKPSNFQQSEDQCSEISSETRKSSYQENHISLQSDGSIVSGSKIDIEVTSLERSGEINGCQSPSMQASEYSVSGFVQKKSTPMLSEDESLVELATIAPEYPSPVSVLDDVVYIDDSPSPLKQIPKTLKDDGTRNSNDNKEQWNPVDNHTSNTLGSGLTSEINRQKLQNIEHLVQKLRRLNSGHDEARTDYIASLCENTNPDHRYISEILLASGLLLRDLGSSLTTFQFHPSGHPINPELFLVLEQTKASTLPKEHLSSENVVQLKPEREKFHRKLIFDATNEILGGKLACVGPAAEPWLSPGKVTRKTLNAQKLLRELCVEIDQFNAKKPECSSEDEDDGLKSILWEDVMRRAESWTDFHCEISGVVLDVERSIFKDLVGEIVMGEAAGLRVKQGRRCRQLFVK